MAFNISPTEFSKSDQLFIVFLFCLFFSPPPAKEDGLAYGKKKKKKKLLQHWGPSLLSLMDKKVHTATRGYWLFSPMTGHFVRAIYFTINETFPVLLLWCPLRNILHVSVVLSSSRSRCAQSFFGEGNATEEWF